MLSLLLRFSLAAVLLSAVLVHADVPADEITSLPGWTGKLPSKHYSGFFPTTTDGSQGAMLHYWLTLSENKPATDPLVVWLQGGPGCSSLFGLLYENGQFRFSGETDNSTGLPTLVQNPYAWTKVANMLWLEQPVGVGFSYCLSDNCTCDYEGCPFGIDAYGFFVNFFKGYPELSKLDFHISGESYGGVYVPYVADSVLMGNQQGGNQKVNLKGILIGNGVGGLLNATEQLRRRSDFFYGQLTLQALEQRLSKVVRRQRYSCRGNSSAGVCVDAVVRPRHVQLSAAEAHRRCVRLEQHLRLRRLPVRCVLSSERRGRLLHVRT